MDFFNLFKDTFFFFSSICLLCNDSFYMPVLFLQILLIFLQGTPLMTPAPSFRLSNICTKLVFSLLIQSCAHHWKRYQVVLDSQLYDETCLAFWRAPWSTFALLAVCCVLLAVTGAVGVRGCCSHDITHSSWVPVAQQEGLNAVCQVRHPFLILKYLWPESVMI